MEVGGGIEVGVDDAGGVFAKDLDATGVDKIGAVAAHEGVAFGELLDALHGITQKVILHFSLFFITEIDIVLFGFNIEDIVVGDG